MSEEKDKINKIALKLSEKHKHLVLEHPTSSGKGLRVAVCIANSKSLKKWLICVPEIAQIANYKEDLIKHGYDWLLKDKIENIICYASLKNYENTEFNLHFNECHRMSEFRTDIAQTISFDKIISDSATISEEISERLWNIEPFHSYKITFEEAIELNLIPQPTFNIMSIILDNVVKSFIWKLKEKEIKVTQQEWYNKLSDNIKYWQSQYGQNRENWQLNKMLQLSIQRKRWLSLQKTEKIKEVISYLQNNNKRFICFTGSVEQANELGKNQCINATKGKKNNQKIIEDFNNLTTDSLYSCAMVVEGMNFTSIDAAILCQLDKAQRANIQKIGRSLRSKNPEIYIVYVKNTQDEKYLNEFLLQIDEKYVNY